MAQSGASSFPNAAFPVRVEKILVTGGRNFGDYERLCRVLDELKPTHIIHGGAKGADTLANQYAIARRLVLWIYPADWWTHGRSAGPKRNAAMLMDSVPHKVVAFPGGAGTHDMVKRAKDAGYEVIEG